MGVRIRLQRFGVRNNPFYRIVAADSRAKRDGRFIEMLGTYDPIPDANKTKQVRLKVDRFKYWVAHGATPSDRVATIASRFNLYPPLPVRATIPMKDVHPDLIPETFVPKLPAFNPKAEAV